MAAQGSIKLTAKIRCLWSLVSPKRPITKHLKFVFPREGRNGECSPGTNLFWDVSVLTLACHCGLFVPCSLPNLKLRLMMSPFFIGASQVRLVSNSSYINLLLSEKIVNPVVEFAFATSLPWATKANFTTGSTPSSKPLNQFSVR